MADDVMVPARTGLGSSFWRMWTAAGLSSLADGVLKVALPLLAVGFTRSPALIAGLTFAFTLPWLLFALPAGALADRIDRRRAMLGANIMRAVLLGTLVVLMAAGGGTIWALFVIAAGVGIAETLYDTSAQSIVPQVVGRGQLSRANGRMYAAELTANEFAGPPLAGVLVAAGVLWALSAPVLLWVVAVVALLLVRGSFRIERESRTTIRADIAEGLGFLWRNHLLRTFAVMVGVFNFATGATFAILVLYAVGPESAMGLSEQAFGVLLAANAAGSLLGSIAAEPIERRLGRTRTLALAFAVATLTVVSPALTSNAFAIGAAFVVGGAAILVSNVVMVSLRQRVTPDRLLGRVNSGHRLVAWGTKPLGAVAGGLITQLFGLRAVFAIMAVLAIAVLAGLRVVTEKAIADAECAAAHS